jgi:diguanylate cyclase (GGDEF)-like protein/PAS domain S-box-containing protein
LATNQPASPGAELGSQRYELLRTDPQRYAEMVRSISRFGIYWLDRAGVIRSWNLGAQNITGFDPAEVIGKPFAHLFTDRAVQESIPQKALALAHTNRHHRDEQSRRHVNGNEIFVFSTLDALRAESGEVTGYVDTFYDVTEQKARDAVLYRQATRDPMTGIANRGHFMEVANQEIERARRFSEPLSVLLLDIDHFKTINDTFGHDVGDQAIILLARTCSDFVRKIDTVGRLGGEEFAILLPRANKEPAYEMAQRLRQKIAEQHILLPQRDLGFTVSIGVASMRPYTRDFAELLRNADTALYKAKRLGRNRVEVWFE